MLSNIPVINFTNSRMLTGGPTTGKTSFIKGLAEQGLSAVDTDAIAERLFPEWFSLRLWRSILAGDKLFFNHRIGWAVGAMAACDATKFFVTNIYGDSFAWGILEGACSIISSQTSDRREQVLRALPIVTSLGIRPTLLDHEATEVGHYIKRVPVQETEYSTRLAKAAGRSLIDAAAYVRQVAESPTFNGDYNYTWTWNHYFSRCSGEAISRISARRSTSIPTSLGAKWVKTVTYASARGTFERVFWLDSVEKSYPWAEGQGVVPDRLLFDPLDESGGVLCLRPRDPSVLPGNFLLTSASGATRDIFLSESVTIRHPQMGAMGQLDRELLSLGRSLRSHYQAAIQKSNGEGNGSE